VRQGCPLAPPLYLFVAWALACWLKACPEAGVEVVPGRVVHSVHYADDAEVVLKDMRPDTVKGFLDHMAVFGRASGQWLNAGKSRLLPVGAVEEGQPLPPAVSGIQVVHRACTLGLGFANGGDDMEGVDWQEKVGWVGGRFAKLAKLHLSIFGRAQAAGAYGLGGLLFQAEHAGLPEVRRVELQRLAVRLVDRGLGPDSGERRLPGVRSGLLVGRPRLGGFGLLPLEQHVRARHAMLGRQLVVWTAGDPRDLLREGWMAPPPPTPLWVGLAERVLAGLCPGAHPALALLTAAAVAAGGQLEDHRLPGQWVAGALPPGPLRRMLAGLQALGPVEEVAEGGLTGEVVLLLPLWGNPLLQLEFRQDQRSVAWAMEGTGGTAEARAAWATVHEGGFRPWLGTPGLFTVGDLYRLAACLRSVRMEWLRRPLPQAKGEWRGGGRQVVMDAVWGPGTSPFVLPAWVGNLVRTWSPWEQSLQDQGSHLLLEVEAMVAALPEAWRRQAVLERSRQRRAMGMPLVVAGTGVPGALRLDQRCLDLVEVQPAVRALVRNLGWRCFALGGRQTLDGGVVLWPLSVRAATRLQLGSNFDAQGRARAEYVADALVGVGAPPPGEEALQGAVKSLREAMGRLWGLAWENRVKEALWRLTVNGVPAAGGHGISLAGPCPCGWAPPATASGDEGSRRWREHCFWGCPVARSVVEQLEAALPGQQVRQANLWLLQAPPGVRACVWEAVCAAALEAVWYGKRRMWALHRERPQAAPGQPLITQFFPVVAGAPPSPSGAAGAQAAARFWELLEGFAALGECPDDERWVQVPEDHPYLGVVTVGGERPRRRLVVRLPAGQASQAGQQPPLADLTST